MKPSKRNLAKLATKTQRVQSRPPVQSRYSAKQANTYMNPRVEDEHHHS